MSKHKYRYPAHPNRTYRDSMFRFLFGNKDHKDWTLSLFNAVCQKDYKDPEMIEFRYTDDILFIKIREDVVFLYGSTLSFFEHQSTWSPNLPYRMLEYAAKQFAAAAEENRQAVFSKEKLKFPKPKFFVLYNGRDKDIPAEMTLKLSGSYDTINRTDELGDAYDLEVIVHVININSGMNESLQAKCRPLEEYTWVTSSIREETDRGMTLKDAVNTVLRKIPENFVIRDAMMEERGRVTAMLFDEEWNARQLEKLKDEYLQKGISQNKTDVTRAMILKGYPDTEIIEITGIEPEFLKTVKENLTNVKTN